MSDWNAFLSNRTVQTLATVALLIGAVGETFVFVINSQKLKIQTQVASNAPALQPAEARLAEMKAKVAQATAGVAAKLKASEAELAEQKARIERATAEVADIERQATLEKEEALAISQAAVAQVAEQKQWLEAELKELELLQQNLLSGCCGLKPGDVVAASMAVTSPDIWGGSNVNPDYFGVSSRHRRGYPPGISRAPIGCRQTWLKWKDATSFGAFAVSTEEACGFSTALDSIETADADALSRCRQANSSKQSKCAVLQRLVPSPYDVAVSRSSKPVAQVASQVPTALASNKVPSATSSSDRFTFTIYDNYDMLGGDLAILRDTTLEACNVTCRDDPRCVAYSFDKWNNACYPKGTMPQLAFSGRSKTAVRDSQPEPVFATIDFHFEHFKQRAFPSNAEATKPTATYDACETLCSDTEWCAALTFVRTSRDCKMYRSTAVYQPDNNSVSAAKVQSPPALPPAAPEGTPGPR